MAPGRVRVADRRLRHVREILRAKPGDALVVGRIDGRLGPRRVVALDARALELEVALERAAAGQARRALALALPRPPSLRKVLQQATALGVKRFVLFASARVEKSYWQSSGLAPDALREQLLLGLEQAGDTRAARDRVRAPLPRASSSDELPALARGAPILVAHPGARRARRATPRRAVRARGRSRGRLHAARARRARRRRRARASGSVRACCASRPRSSRCSRGSLVDTPRASPGYSRAMDLMEKLVALCAEPRASSTRRARSTAASPASGTTVRSASSCATT